MRTYLFLFFSFIIFGVLATNTVSAQSEATSTVGTSTASTSASSTSRLEDRVASSTQRREDRQELQNQRQAALNAVRQQRVLNLSANLSNRLDAVSNRQLTIITRLESRINKMTAAGFDTNAASVKLREASDAASRAKSKLASIDNIVNSATTSTEPQNRWASVRETYRDIISDTRLAHAALKEVVILLKAAVETPKTKNETGTTTESN